MVDLQVYFERRPRLPLAQMTHMNAYCIDQVDLDMRTVWQYRVIITKIMLLLSHVQTSTNFEWSKDHSNHV